MVVVVPVRPSGRAVRSQRLASRSRRSVEVGRLLQRPPAAAAGGLLHRLWSLSFLMPPPKRPEPWPRPSLPGGTPVPPVRQLPPVLGAKPRAADDGLGRASKPGLATAPWCMGTPSPIMLSERRPRLERRSALSAPLATWPVPRLACEALRFSHSACQSRYRASRFSNGSCSEGRCDAPVMRPALTCAGKSGWTVSEQHSNISSRE
mmetsp:Transcript_15231/g.48520  ORF Transcript_15231/g.48520 Transcript_15231/m.48520 type:complete len:206 (-) Transcript_15231:224-841(-)